MSNEPRFHIDGDFKVAQRDILVKVALAIQGGDTAGAWTIFSDPANLAEIYNNIGAQDYFYKKAYPDGPPGPTPAPTDPAQSIRARATTFGKWAAWKLATSAELDAMKAEFGVTPVAQLVNFYGESGGGGISVQGGIDPDGVPFFWALVNGNEVRTKDVDGAADAYVLEMAEAQGRKVPTSPI